MKFKKHAIAIMLAASMPAWTMAAEAAPGFDGFVSIGYGKNNLKNDRNNSSNEDIGDLRFSGAYTSASGFGGQIDNVYSRQRIGSGATINTTDLAGHLYYRNSNYLLGVMAQRRTFDFSLHTGDPSADLSADASMDLVVSDRTFLGLEGQAYFGDLTVAVQGGKQTLGSPILKAQSGSNPDGSFANVQTRYFIKDNWRVDGSISYGNIDVMSGSLKSKGLALGTEYRFSDSPISVFAKYDYLDNSAGSTDLKNHRAMVGVKFNFGKETLKSRDRDGASLNPVPVDNTLLTLQGLGNT